MTQLPQSIRQQLRDASSQIHWSSRAKAIERLATTYCNLALDEAARQTLEDFFRSLRYDGETLTRQVLSECLKRASHLPRDIAMALATGPAASAASFIRDSEALGDDDLLLILRDHPGPHRLAVAGREPLSERVCGALLQHGEEAAIGAMLANESAALGISTLRRLADHDSLWVRTAAARRLGVRGLPSLGATDLVSRVTTSAVGRLCDLESYLFDEPISRHHPPGLRPT